MCTLIAYCKKYLLSNKQSSGTDTTYVPSFEMLGYLLIPPPKYRTKQRYRQRCLTTPSSFRAHTLVLLCMLKTLGLRSCYRWQDIIMKHTHKWSISDEQFFHVKALLYNCKTEQCFSLIKPSFKVKVYTATFPIASNRYLLYWWKTNAKNCHSL